MYVILWEYQVKPNRIAEFESVYGADGTWAKLFQKSEGYLGTELLRDQNKPHCFVTIDRWTSVETYNLFKEKWREEYNALDAICEGLTEHEAFIGAYY